MEKLTEIINVARGVKKADLVLKNAKILNVFTGEIHENDVAIKNNIIVSIGKDLCGLTEIDIEGKYLSPSFIDGHVHIESSMLLPHEFAKAVVPTGTTSVIADPHEIANVLGLQGISFIKETTEKIPLDVYIMLPSCVPATNLESSGSQLDAGLLSFIADQPWILGLAEMMNFPGVLNNDESVIKKLKLAKHKIMDGHCPALKGQDLCAYIAAGITSDHECTNIEEAKEKLALGMHIMIREGTVAKDLDSILPLINEITSRRCFFVTDDRCPMDLYDHINSMVRRAVKSGIPPITAIQMASLNVAEYFKIPHKGAIAPGYIADMLVFEDLKEFKPEMVFKSGKLVAKNGIFLQEDINYEIPNVRRSVNVKWIEPDDFKIKAESDMVKTINIRPQQLITDMTVEEIIVKDGYAESNLENDVLKIIVIERHSASGSMGKGFVKGFGLKSGAIASTIAHDSHNMVIIGTNDKDMCQAAIELVKSQGGKVIVENGKVLEKLPLPIAGLISDKSASFVVEKAKNLSVITKQLGCVVEDPFMQMAFLSLPVIPDIKITDKGLIDVNKFEITNLFVV